MHRKGFDVLQHVLGQEHPYTLTSMENLASTLHAQGKHNLGSSGPSSLSMLSMPM